jgi:hypothetical protein
MRDLEVHSCKSLAMQIQNNITHEVTAHEETYAPGGIFSSIEPHTKFFAPSSAVLANRLYMILDIQA